MIKAVPYLFLKGQHHKSCYTKCYYMKQTHLDPLINIFGYGPDLGEKFISNSRQFCIFFDSADFNIMLYINKNLFTLW